MKMTEQQLNEVKALMADDMLHSTSTHHEMFICKCGEQCDRFVNVNTAVRAVRIDDHCGFCGYRKFQPWEIVEERQ